MRLNGILRQNHLHFERFHCGYEGYRKRCFYIRALNNRAHRYYTLRHETKDKSKNRGAVRLVFHKIVDSGYGAVLRELVNESRGTELARSSVYRGRRRLAKDDARSPNHSLARHVLFSIRRLFLFAEFDSFVISSCLPEAFLHKFVIMQEFWFLPRFWVRRWYG